MTIKTLDTFLIIYFISQSESTGSEDIATFKVYISHQSERTLLIAN